MPPTTHPRPSLRSLIARVSVTLLVAAAFIPLSTPSADAYHCASVELPDPGTLRQVPAFNVIIGTPGDDHIVGTEGPDLINAGAGNDVIEARGGTSSVATRATTSSTAATGPTASTAAPATT